MNKSPSDTIFQIEEKINLVLSENESLRKKVVFLENELSEHRNLIISEREKVKNLENQIKINNIAKRNIEGEENVKEMRAKINEVIREVDRCIRYLKN